MIQKRLLFLNSILYVFILILFIGMQTTLWYNWMGATPAPQLWLNLILFLILYRSALGAIFLSYLLGFIIAVYSAIPLSTIWPILFLLVTIGSFLRRRFFWPSTRYFILASALLCLGYQIIFYIVSHMFEHNPTSVAFFARFTEIFLTAIVAAPQYWFFKWVDRMTFGELSERAFEVTPEGAE